MSTCIPWGFVMIGAFCGFTVGLLFALPLIWWATRETEEEKAARLPTIRKIRAVFPIPDPPPAKQRPEEDDDFEEDHRREP